MKSPKVYIAAPFRIHSARDAAIEGAAYGEMADPDRIGLLERIESTFLAARWTTCLPHRDEGNWGKTYYEPEAISPLCLRHVETSNLICAIPARSRGVHIELAWAAKCGIPLLVFKTPDEEISTLIPGLALKATDSTRLPPRGQMQVVTVDSYDEIPDFIAKLLATDSATKSPEHRLAIVDIGSNSLKLSIRSVNPLRRPIPTRDDSRESIGIADSVGRYGTLQDEDLKQISEVLTKFSEATSADSAEVIVVGTEALRRAANVDKVRSIVNEIFHIELKILTHRDEATAVASAVADATKYPDATAALNLGAASTQLIVPVDEGTRQLHLYKFGTKDITATHPWTRPMSSSQWGEVRSQASDLLRRQPIGAPARYLFHTGGELDFLLRCRVPMKLCSASDSHVSMIDIQDFADFARRFAASDPAEVARTTRLSSGWLSGSVASNAIALETAQYVGAEHIVPSNLNISDGLLRC